MFPYTKTGIPVIDEVSKIIKKSSLNDGKVRALTNPRLHENELRNTQTTKDRIF
jgi:hypothetical protein